MLFFSCFLSFLNKQQEKKHSLDTVKIFKRYARITTSSAIFIFSCLPVAYK